MRRLPDRTVVFDPVKREDAGTYECQARIRGRDIEKLLRVSVVVNGWFLLNVNMKLQLWGLTDHFSP